MSAKRLSGSLPSQVLLRKIREGKRTWIEIDHAAIRHNVSVFRKLIGSKVHPPKFPSEKLGRVKLWAVVKSNAYGHGLMAFSPLALQTFEDQKLGGRADKAGVDGFCVDSIIEGLRLRKIGIKKPILVLGLTLPNRFAEAARHNITLSISSFEGLAYLAKQKRPPKFHVKFDTGMHRQGFYAQDVHKILSVMSKSKFQISKHLRGVFTHFASATSLRDTRYADRQFAEFLRIARAFEHAGYRNLVCHVSATGGTLLGRKYHLNAVRVGMGLYGHWPSRELEQQLSKKIALKPVLSWRTVVGEVKRLERGDRVGYDLTERIAKSTIAAVLPIGYWHGFPRSLSGRSTLRSRKSVGGTVLIRGKHAKVLGRVSMDIVVVDATRAKPRVGDVVTLIGRDGREELRAPDVAERSGTSHYEFLTRLNPLIERVIV